MFKHIRFFIALTILLAAACSLQVSQESVRGSGNIITDNRDVSGFDSVDICCGMQLTLIQGEREALEIQADDNILPEIVTRVRGDKLSIEYRNMNSRIQYRPSRAVRCTLNVKDLRQVESSGGGYVESENINTDTLTLDLSGGGDARLDSVSAQSIEVEVSGGGEFTARILGVGQARINLSGGSDASIQQLDADELRLDSSGGGEVRVAGSVNEQTAEFSGGGSYNAADLESQTANIDISGNGEGIVWVLDSLEVNLSGGSDLSYYGSPQISQTLSGGSQLKSLGEH